MRAAVIVFPGSNCDRDIAESRSSASPAGRSRWSGTATRRCRRRDLIVLPGGFSYGDYLRCGAMAAHSPIMRDVVAKAKAGTPVLGICNGFQIAVRGGPAAGRADAQRLAASSSAATCT